MKKELEIKLFYISLKFVCFQEFYWGDHKDR